MKMILFFVSLEIFGFLLHGVRLEPLILSSLIKQNRIQEARNLCAVDTSHFLGVPSYSGFLTVDESHSSNLFFWYFPVTDRPRDKTPWIIWLQGGPGASSLAGLFDEIGPFQYNNGKLQLREYSWSKEHSLVFIDNPVGAGFSYTKDDSGYATSMEMYSAQLEIAINQFVTLFPELRNAPLFLGGESYAGRYVPALAARLKTSTGTNMTEDKKTREINNATVNLEGLIMGNPVFKRTNIADYTSAFYNWGLIDDQQAIAVKPLQEKYTKALKSRDFSLTQQLQNQLLEKLLTSSFQMHSYNPFVDEYDLEGFESFINRPEIKRAIHTEGVQFTFSNPKVKTKLVADFLSETQPKIEDLLERYRILIYCGQFDLTAACVPNSRARRFWRWSRRSQFLQAPRTPWWHNETVAGYVKSGGGLTEVLVKGAGHLVTIDKPAQAQTLVSYFIRNLDLPLPTNYVVDWHDTPEFTEDSGEANPIVESHSFTATISVLLNIVLLVFIILSAVYWFRWRRRNEGFLYTTTEDFAADGMLTLT